MSSTETPPTPDLIMHYLFGHVPAQALQTAVELDLFTRIERGLRTEEQLAEATDASVRGVKLLTGALCAMKLLERGDGGLVLTPVSRLYLSRDSASYLGTLTLQINCSWEAWGRLTEAVKTGTASDQLFEADRGNFFAQWVEGLFSLNYPAAKAVSDKYGAQAQKVLDIGPGSGVWSLTLAREHPRAEVVLVDLEDVSDLVTRRFAEQLGVTERCEFRFGDFHQVNLGEEQFDLAFLGHILHSEGDEPSLKLVRRISRALKPGGRLVIAEMMPDEERSTDLFGNLFGLNMLVHTEQGNVYTPSELETMAREGGFSSLEWFHAPAPYPLLVARKD